jgi:hypothetical protein
VSGFPNEMLQVLNKHPSVNYLTIRTCFEYIRSATDVGLLGFNSKLVSLSFYRYRCHSKIQEYQRDRSLAILLACLPNIKHLELSFATGEDRDQAWYCAPTRDISAQTLPPLQTLTLHGYHIDFGNVQSILRHSGYAGFIAFRLINPLDFSVPSDLWQLLSLQTRALEIIDPATTDSTTYDPWVSRRALSAIFRELFKLEALNLQNIGVPFCDILLGLGANGVFLRHLRLHDLGLSGLDRFHEIRQWDDFLTMEGRPGRRWVELLGLLRKLCPNLTKLSVDLSRTGLMTDVQTAASAVTLNQPHYSMLRTIKQNPYSSSIRGIIRSFRFLRYLTLVVNLQRSDWTRDYALGLASSFWTSALHTFELLSPWQNSMSPYKEFCETWPVLTTDQPWWVVTRKNYYNGLEINIQPENLIAVDRNAPHCKVDRRAWLDLTE